MRRGHCLQVMSSAVRPVPAFLPTPTTAPMHTGDCTAGSHSLHCIFPIAPAAGGSKGSSGNTICENFSRSLWFDGLLVQVH